MRPERLTKRIRQQNLFRRGFSVDSVNPRTIIMTGQVTEQRARKGQLKFGDRRQVEADELEISLIIAKV